MSSSESEEAGICIKEFKGWIGCRCIHDKGYTRRCAKHEKRPIFETCKPVRIVIKAEYAEKGPDGKEIDKCKECRDIPEPGPPKSWDEKMEAVATIEKRRW